MVERFGRFGPAQEGEFEPNKFEQGDIIRPIFESDEEFIEIIGNAYYEKLKGGRFSAHAADLVRQASKCLRHVQFKVMQYVPAYKGEVGIAYIKPISTDEMTADKTLEDPDIKELNDEFRTFYGTGLLFFLYTETIKVDVSDFEKSTTS